VKQARAYTSDIEFSPEDASRTELEFLEEIVQAVVEKLARTTVNLPDTVGYATPKNLRRDFFASAQKAADPARAKRSFCRRIAMMISDWRSPFVVGG